MAAIYPELIDCVGTVKVFFLAKMDSDAGRMILELVPASYQRCLLLRICLYFLVLLLFCSITKVILDENNCFLKKISGINNRYSTVRSVTSMETLLSI